MPRNRIVNALRGRAQQKKRQRLPPVRRYRNIGASQVTEVHPLPQNARVTVDEPDFNGTWLVHLPGTTSDPSIFPPDRTLPQIAFDFRELSLEDPTPPDPFQVFHNLLEHGLLQAFQKRSPKHLVFVGHSFGGMLTMNYLVNTNLAELKRLIPTVESVSAVLIGAAHQSPIARFRIHSNAPLVGPFATWLSHYIARLGTSSRERMAIVKSLVGDAPPRELWRKAIGTDDELQMCADLPQASSLDHFWTVVRCAQEYDVPTQLSHGGRLWFPMLILSAEYDAQWPEDMFDDFWVFLRQINGSVAQWCHFPGDDHMSIARHPTKYYKEIKDFILMTQS